MNCPQCNEPCDQDEVDVGVGVIYGPARCLNCGWYEGHQINEIIDNEREEEKQEEEKFNLNFLEDL
jgi:hypothetical protein